MRPTSPLSFRPSLLALEERAVPATLVELQNVQHIVSTLSPGPGPSTGGTGQTAGFDQVVVLSPVVRPLARRF